jgi:hypothetical protein
MAVSKCPYILPPGHVLYMYHCLSIKIKPSFTIHLYCSLYNHNTLRLIRLPVRSAYHRRSLAGALILAMLPFVMDGHLLTEPN